MPAEPACARDMLLRNMINTLFGCPADRFPVVPKLGAVHVGVKCLVKEYSEQG